MLTRGFPRPTALAMLLCAAAIVVVLHALRPDVNPAIDYVSQYGNDDWSWLFGAALVFCALGLFSLGSALRETEDGHGGSTLMRVAAVLLGIVGVFPSDRRGEAASVSLTGLIHGTAAIAALFALTAAVAVISLRGPVVNGVRAGSRRLRGRAMQLVLGALVLGVVSVALAPEAQGLRQRVFLVVVFGWVLFIAHRVRSADRDLLPAT